MALLTAIYNFLWGDLFRIPLPGGSSLGVSLLVLILLPAGVYFTLRTRFLPFRLFPEMVRITMANNKKQGAEGLSGVQALIVSTACRVGMGNLVGVVAAISAGGAGAVFWMWLIALLGSSTAFIEATLAQLYKEKDPLYGGWRGGPAYYLHALFAKGKRRSVLAVLFAVSGLVCWCGISQVIGNSISSSFENAFNIPPLWSTVALVAVAAVIVLRRNATVKVLDVVVPLMAACYFFITLAIILLNAEQLPAGFGRIISEACGLRQAVSGGLGAVIMNGAKRGLFSNEAGSGSAPCAAAAAHVSHPAKAGLMQALGVFIDTLLICSCTAMVMLLTPASLTEGWRAWTCCRRPWATTWGRSAWCSSRWCCGCSASPPFWASSSTPAPTWPISSATAGAARRPTSCWRWSCSLWAALRPTSSCGTWGTWASAS